jgi:hypothetical protein
MAISFYEKGELSSGFHGFKTAAMIRGKYKQKWFTMNRPSKSIPQDFWRHYQNTRAKYYEARWAARSAACQYLDYIRTNHKSTKPLRGLGMHGLTIGIGKGNRCFTDQCYFCLNKKGKATKITISEHKTLTLAWREAVTKWGQLNGIREKDIQQKLSNPPSPDAFKALRIFLNEHEGKDIAPIALRHVYAERRQQIANQKVELPPSTKEDKLVDENELLDLRSALERELLNFRSRSAS